MYYVIFIYLFKKFFCQDHEYKKGSFSLCVCIWCFYYGPFCKDKILKWITELTTGSFSCQRKKKEKCHSHLDQVKTPTQ